MIEAKRYIVLPLADVTQSMIDVTKANLNQKIFQFIKNSSSYGGWDKATDA